MDETSDNRESNRAEGSGTANTSNVLASASVDSSALPPLSASTPKNTSPIHFLDAQDVDGIDWTATDARIFEDLQPHVFGPSDRPPILQSEPVYRGAAGLFRASDVDSQNGLPNGSGNGESEQLFERSTDQGMDGSHAMQEARHARTPRSFDTNFDQEQRDKQWYQGDRQSTEDVGQYSYHPEQSSYDPQQSSYDPQQSSYDPQQSSYDSQQSSYHPRQSSYHPQQSTPTDPYSTHPQQLGAASQSPVDHQQRAVVPYSRGQQRDTSQLPDGRSQQHRVGTALQDRQVGRVQQRRQQHLRPSQRGQAVQQRKQGRNRMDRLCGECTKYHAGRCLAQLCNLCGLKHMAKTKCSPNSLHTIRKQFDGLGDQLGAILSERALRTAKSKIGDELRKAE